MSTRTLRRAAVAATAVMAPLIVSPSGDASAVTYHITTNRPVAYIQASPSVAAATITTAGNGTAVDVICQAPGDQSGVAPYPTNATWDYVAVNGTRGWVVDMRVTTPGNGTRTNLANGGYFLPSLGIPRCSSAAAVVNPVVANARSAEEAISWMTAQMNISPRTTNSAYTGGSPQNNQYNWWCARAVWTAFTYGRSVTGLGAGSAIDLWNRIPTVHKRHGDTNPPRGAQVFYNHTAWGHTAISLGNGQIITTNGPGGNIAVMPLGSFPNYLGWSPFAG